MVVSQPPPVTMALSACGILPRSVSAPGSKDKSLERNQCSLYEVTIRRLLCCFDDVELKDKYLYTLSNLKMLNFKNS